jgi:hypothetical protein
MRQPVALLRRLATADMLFTVGLVVVFAAAYAATWDWPIRTALFPRLVAGVSFLLAILKLLSLLRESALSTAVASEAAGPMTEPSREDVNMQELEYVFAHAGGRAWAEALSWVAAFFIGLYVLGLDVTAPVFAVCYLWFVAKTSWQVSLAYAAVIVLIFYGGFGKLLELPVPSGLF